MNFTDFAKQFTLQDIMILNLDELNFTDTQIATMLSISKPTIHNTKKRCKPFLEALKQLDSPPTEYGNKDINKIVNAFAMYFGSTKTTQYDRWAAKRLADKYTSEKMVGAIQALSAVQTDKYAPTVRSVSQFEDKLPQIISYFKKKSNDQVIEL